MRHVLSEPRRSGKAQQLGVCHGQSLLGLLGLKNGPDGCHILSMHCQVICQQWGASEASMDLYVAGTRALSKTLLQAAPHM